MISILGECLNKSELLQRVGDMSQLAGIRRSVLTEGSTAGVETIEVRTGSGFRFDVLPGRGMDIGLAEFCGTPLCWISPMGEVSPAHYDSDGLGWLRTYHGGLLVGCGLYNVGDPSTDGANSLGLHGRLSNTPAECVSTSAEWEGDRYILRVRGSVREARLFGENLKLTRTITAEAGCNHLSIEDVVVNQGFQPTPHMYLHHLNFGFPVVSERSRLVAPVLGVEPRDEVSSAGVESYDLFAPPQPGFKDQVFFLKLAPDESGVVHCGLLRRDPVPFGVALDFHKEDFPFFTQWKMTGQGTYLVGLEPGNCAVQGMEIERLKGRLQILNPGESRRYRLTISVITSDVEADRLESAVGSSNRDT